MEIYSKELFIIGSAILLFLGMLSLEKALRKENPAGLFLVVFMFIAALYYATYGIYNIAPEPFSAYGNIIRMPLVLSFIPLFFLFLRDSVTGTTQKYKYVIRHLIIPGAFIVLIPVLLIISSGDQPKSDWLINVIHISAQIILVSQIIYYTLRMFRRYSRYAGKLRVFYNENPSQSFKIRNLLVAFVIFILVLDNWFMSFLIPPRLFNVVYPILLLAAASLTGWLGLITEARKCPRSDEQSDAFVMREQENVSEKIKEQDKAKVQPSGLQSPASFDASDAITENAHTVNSLNSSEAFDLERRTLLHTALLKYMEEQEPFLDAKLTIRQLASLLNTNSRYLSIVINEFEGCNFNQLLNRYRVNKVIRLLVDNQAKSYSFFGLAQRAGFNSKSVFISSFKSQTGQTPTAFANSMKKLIQV
ncbi:hypothetical protein MASR1M74_02720 [Lentimicrobium sp.]